MLLIADSGSSKTSWRLVNKQDVLSFHTEGLNPYYKTVGEIKTILQQDLISHLQAKPEDITQIYFYGAGCSAPKKCEEVKNALSHCFPAAKVVVDHDIIGAARACCGHEKGIVGILGTGSNSCYYDGKSTTEIIGGLGYILGDEGSGVHIGKAIVSAYLTHEMPGELKKVFDETYHLDRATIDSKVYLQPNANRFLASFSLFAEEYKAHPFIHHIIEDCFNLYLDKHVCRYSNYKETTVHFVGSVGYYNKDILVELCTHKGIKTGRFILQPVDELVGFHKYK